MEANSELQIFWVSLKQKQKKKKYSQNAYHMKGTNKLTTKISKNSI